MALVGLVAANWTTLTAAEVIERDLIAAQGHLVEVKSSSDADLAAWAATKALVVYGSSAPYADASKLRTAATKVLMIGTSGAGARYSLLGIGGVLSSSTNSTWRVAAGRDGQDIVAGQVGAFDAWTSGAAKSFWVTDPVAGATVLAYQGNGSTQVVMFHVPVGTALAGGGTAPAARYGLSGHPDAVALYSAAPAQWRNLLTALVVHAVGKVSGPTPVKPAPIVTITTPPTLVEDAAPVPLSATVDLNGGSPVTSIVWSAPGLTLTGATTFSPTVAASTSGQFTVKVVVANADGLTDDDSVLVNVVAAANADLWPTDGAGGIYAEELGAVLPVQAIYDYGDGTAWNFALNERIPWPPVPEGAGVWSDTWEDTWGA